MSTDDLLRGLPTGEAHYSRNSSGRWDVVIFRPGGVEPLFTFAENLDKSAACWLMIRLNDAMQSVREVQKGEQ